MGDSHWECIIMAVCVSCWSSKNIKQNGHTNTDILFLIKIICNRVRGTIYERSISESSILGGEIRRVLYGYAVIRLFETCSAPTMLFCCTWISSSSNPDVSPYKYLHPCIILIMYWKIYFLVRVWDPPDFDRRQVFLRAHAIGIAGQMRHDWSVVTSSSFSARTFMANIVLRQFRQILARSGWRTCGGGPNERISWRGKKGRWRGCEGLSIRAHCAYLQAPGMGWFGPTALVLSPQKEIVRMGKLGRRGQHSLL